MTFSLTRLMPFIRSSGPSLSRRLIRLASLHRSRRALARLDANQLADVGLSAETATAEARRKVWDVPKNWTH